MVTRRRLMQLIAGAVPAACLSRLQRHRWPPQPYRAGEPSRGRFSRPGIRSSNTSRRPGSATPVGIWAHWTAQCVPDGDWYARRMYLQGDPANVFHEQKYGHPSQFGFMEIDNLWKAERWEPAALMDLYFKAGARYFVALANHHDNFDAYESSHHAWNAVRVGPKKDRRHLGAARTRSAGCASASPITQRMPGTGFSRPMATTRRGRKRRRPLRRVPSQERGRRRADGGRASIRRQLYTGPNLVMPDGIRR